MAENWNGYADGNTTGYGINSTYRTSAVSFTSTTPVDAVRVEVASAGSFYIQVHNSDGSTLLYRSEAYSVTSRMWATYVLPEVLPPGSYRVMLYWISGSINWIATRSEVYSGANTYGPNGVIITGREYNMQYREYAPNPSKRWTGTQWVPATIKRYDGSGWVEAANVVVTH